jgi:hypothetical protein
MIELRMIPNRSGGIRINVDGRQQCATGSDLNSSAAGADSASSIKWCSPVLGAQHGG